MDGGRKRLELHACTFLHFWLSAVSERTSTSVRYQIDHRSSMFRDYAAWNYTFKWSEWNMLAVVLWFNKSMILIYCRSLLQSSRSIRGEVASQNQFSVKSLITIFSRFALCSFPLFISDVIVMSMLQFFFVWCNSRYFTAAITKKSKNLKSKWPEALGVVLCSRP